MRGVGGIVSVFGFMGLLGLIRPDSAKRSVQRKEVSKRGLTSRQGSTLRGTSDGGDELDEDIHFEDGESESTAAPTVSEPDSDDEVDDEIEVIEERPISMDDFEARLDRLRKRRDQIGGD